MNYGSELVYMYSDSDEEYVSGTELQEGMWLSEDSDDDDDDQTPASAAATPAALPQATDMEGSTTKYLPPEGSSDEEEDAVKSADKGGGGGGDKLNYVEVRCATGEEVKKKPAAPVEAKSRRPLFGKRKSKKDSPPAPPPPPALVPVPGPPSPPLLLFSSATAPAAPPPPAVVPAHPRGIIKNRLTSHRVKKLKQTRVNWSRQEENAQEQRQQHSRMIRGRRVRRSDTNILSVNFHTLSEPSDVHTGDAVICANTNCASILSHFSALTQQQQDQHTDEKENKVEVEAEEVPNKKDTTYLIAPPMPVEGVAGGGVDMEASLVIFCIDISGSMCVTAEVPGKFELKGHDRVKGLSSLNVDRQDQYLPQQRRNVTYVSRLQSVQAAVDYQLSDLTRTHPTQRVALVTFSNEVNVLGDGDGEVVTLAGDKLNNLESIMKAGEDIALPAPVQNTSKTLSKRIFELEEGGQTALGPALLVSISLASRIPGSKVIICTDGLANNGVGNLDGLVTPEERAEAQTFYEDMGTLAKEKDVTVSLVRIKGTDCKALELGQVADKTGGQVTTVDPLNITKEFSSILANPVIATNVTTKIVLHGQLYFRSEDSQESVCVIPVGNVTAETELTYEYGVRKKTKKKAASPKGGAASPGGGASASAQDPPTAPPLQVGGKPHLPFQLQVEYTSRDGSRLMRVITDAKPITRDRTAAEKDIHMNVVGTHVAQRTAKLAMDGEYTTARLAALSSQRLLQRSSHSSAENRSRYNTCMEDIIPLENALRTKQQVEREQLGRQYSDNESEEEEFYDRESTLMRVAKAKPPRAHTVAIVASSASAPQPRLSVPKKKKAISRRKDINDDLATYCYNMKSQHYD